MEQPNLKGYGFAAASILLVTFAQLAMKWGMSQLPAPGLAWLDIATHWMPEIWVLAGIGAYAASLGCWMMALHSLPLNRAYPLLSISYGLVYLLAGIMPFLHEHYSLVKTLGVVLIVAGVVLINTRPSSAADNRDRASPSP